MEPVHHVLAADLPAVRRTLVAAFRDDPLMRFIVGPDDPEVVLGRWMVFFTDLLFGRGHTYSVPGARAAALWNPPDVDLMDEAWGLRFYEMLGDAIGSRRDEVLGELAATSGFHPEEPHFYLSHLGVDPPDQGRGLGGAVMAPVLDACDRQGLVAYLESSNPRNIAFYERYGFAAVGEVTLGGRAVITPMVRVP